MSERLDRAIAALDVGLQDSPESHVYSDVAPVMADVCVRCQTRDRFEESDWCEGCRAYLLGDGDDPMGAESLRWRTHWSVAEYVGVVSAPRGGIRYVPPPEMLGEWGRWVTVGVASFAFEDGWASVFDEIRWALSDENLPLSYPLRVSMIPNDDDLSRVEMLVEWTHRDEPPDMVTYMDSGTLDLGLRRDSSIPGPRNDLQLFAEEWVSVARVGHEAWPLAREIPVDGYARQAVHHLDGNRYNNAAENLRVIEPRENVRAELRGASADALQTMRDAVESYAHRNQVADDQIDATREALASALQPVADFVTGAVRRFVEWGHEAGIIDEDGQLTEPWRSVVEQQRDARLAQDLALYGEAFTDEDGNRLDPSTVACGVYVDAAGTVALNPLEPFCRDADGNVALRWSPPLGTGDPLTDPVAAAREHVAQRLAEYNASLPPRVEFPHVGSHPVGGCPRCASGEPIDVGIMRDADLFARNETSVFVDHASGPCANHDGPVPVAQFHSQRGH